MSTGCNPAICSLMALNVLWLVIQHRRELHSVTLVGNSMAGCMQHLRVIEGFEAGSPDPRVEVAVAHVNRDKGVVLHLCPSCSPQTLLSLSECLLSDRQRWYAHAMSALKSMQGCAAYIRFQELCPEANVADQNPALLHAWLPWIPHGAASWVLRVCFRQRQVICSHLPYKICPDG